MPRPGTEVVDGASGGRLNALSEWKRYGLLSPQMRRQLGSRWSWAAGHTWPLHVPNLGLTEHINALFADQLVRNTTLPAFWEAQPAPPAAAPAPASSKSRTVRRETSRHAREGGIMSSCAYVHPARTSPCVRERAARTVFRR